MVDNHEQRSQHRHDAKADARIEHSDREHDSNNDDDSALENAIGDAIQQFAMLNENNQNIEETPDELADHSYQHNDQHSEEDINLENVVGDVFKSLAHEVSENYSDHHMDSIPRHEEMRHDGHSLTKHVRNAHNSESDPSESSKDSEEPGPANVLDESITKTQQDDTSSDGCEVSAGQSNVLAAAIGDAFHDLRHDSSTGSNGRESGQFEEGKESVHKDDDLNLENAIGEALKSLAGEFNNAPATSDGGLSQAHPESGNLKQPNMNQPVPPMVDLVNIVQDVVSQINGTDSATTKDEKSSSSSANEANNSVFSNSVNNSKTVPTLDETILAHFHSEANKDDSQHDIDAALKNAVANAVNKAFPKNFDLGSDNRILEGEKDIEKIQMNEILQNAFNMAMQNPEELLKPVNMDDFNESIAEMRRNSLTALSSSVSAASLSVKDALKKQNEKMNTADHQDVKVSHPDYPNKPLSIAETLALHRSSMVNPAKRDYSSINSLDDSMKSDFRGSIQTSSQTHPQLPNILSSLSQHIQSGAPSQNLMSVIRQMTNALMHNKGSTANISNAVQELIKDIQKSPDDKKFYENTFKSTANFLQNTVKEDSSKSLEIIEKIIEALYPRDVLVVDPKIKEQVEGYGDNINGDELMHFYTIALSTLSTFNNTRVQLALSGVKLDVDSSEYKNKIRYENRERKKKWREENAERNKDNDLRSRVLKRASLMFGEGSSKEKKDWVEEEFAKRREKRIAKQKKEQSKVENVDLLQEHVPVSKSKSDTIPQNKKYGDRFNGLFDLVTEFSAEESPQATLIALAAVSAVGTSIHAMEVGVSDQNTMETAMIQSLSSILDSSVRSGNLRKFSFLGKDDKSSANFGSKHNMEKPSLPLSKMDNAFNSVLSNSLGKESQKRFGNEVEDLLKKRQKFSTSDSFTERRVGGDSSIDTGSSYFKNSTFDSGNWLQSVSGLKMPVYKKPTSSRSIDPEISAADNIKSEALHRWTMPTSPFISNKLKGENPGLSGSSGLRKPGSFLKPAGSKTGNKSRSGFPTLYSTSFKSK